MTQPADPKHDPKHPLPYKRPATAQAESAQADKLVLNSPEDATSLKDFLLWGAVILLAVMPAYTPALRGQFIWDDDRHVEQNRNLRDAQGLTNIWTKFGLRHGGTPQYYPLTHTTYWIEYQLFDPLKGPEADTLPFHVTNVLLHVTSAILLWLILRELKVTAAWVIAMIFAIHPIQVESVAWISERKNVLSGALFFGSILAYLKSGYANVREGDEHHRDSGAYGVSLLLFILALLSKSVACSMPAVILVIIWWKRARFTKRDIIPTIPFFVIGLGMAMLTAWLERAEVGADLAHAPELNLSFAQRILIAGRAVWFYIAKLIWPAKLTFIYPRWNVESSHLWQWIFPVAALAVIAILFALRNRIGRAPAAAALIFVGVLFPALGFFNIYPMRYSFVADHFQYLAGPALIALIVAGIAKLLAPLRRADGSGTVAYVLAALAIVVLGILTALQARIYDGQLALWHDTVAKNPGSWMAQYNFGTSLAVESGKLPPAASETANKWLDESMEHFAAAVAAKPDHDRALYNWGQILTKRNKPLEGLDKIRQALAIRTSFEALAGEGQAYFALKKYDDALASYNAAIDFAEKNANTEERVSKNKQAAAYGYLGDALAAKGDVDGALANYLMATELRPELWQVQLARGKLLAEKSRKERDSAVVARLRGEAAVALDRASRYAPEQAEPHVALADLMMDVGNLQGARSQLMMAVPLDAKSAAQSTLRWDRLFTASTRPSTTRSTTTQSATTQSTTRYSTASAATVPATQPSR